MRRWGVVGNVSQEVQGEAGEGTTIDREEPFVLRIRCDEDGWTVQSNREPQYPHFFHLFPPAEVTFHFSVESHVHC